MSIKLDAWETAANTVAGIAISFGMTLLVFPLIGIETNAKSAGAATLAYFVMSTARSFVIRRCFRRSEESHDTQV